MEKGYKDVTCDVVVIERFPDDAGYYTGGEGFYRCRVRVKGTTGEQYDAITDGQRVLICDPLTGDS